MQGRLEKCVRDFLTLRLIPGKRLLLALSGGGDSLALLYLLLSCQDKLDFDLHLAHVDHAWRAESAEESHVLENLARHLKLPMHLKRLSPIEGPNLEERYRTLRYQFFQELQEEWDFQAVLLAHHADDQAETLLKRICEGARLGVLGGLQSEAKRKSLTLWRPLLPIRKKALAQFLQKRKISPFDDWTNRDLSYLRPRMRLQIFPDLEKQFGKNIGSNFYHLGALFQEVSTYLEEKKQQITAQLVTGPFGEYLEAPSRFSQLELRFFFEEKARAAGAHLSRDGCEILLRLIKIEAPKGTIQASPLTFQLTSRCLFILKGPFPSFSAEQWKWKNGKGTWKDFWLGKCQRPQEGSHMLPLSALEPLVRKKMKKWYAKHRVPAFFYDKAPIFALKGKIVGECLTGSDFKHLIVNDLKKSVE